MRKSTIRGIVASIAATPLPRHQPQKESHCDWYKRAVDSLTQLDISRGRSRVSSLMTPFPPGRGGCRSRDPDRGLSPRPPSKSWSRPLDAGRELLESRRGMSETIPGNWLGGGAGVGTGFGIPPRMETTHCSAPIACHCLQCSDRHPPPHLCWRRNLVGSDAYRSLYHCFSRCRVGPRSGKMASSLCGVYWDCLLTRRQ